MKFLSRLAICLLLLICISCKQQADQDNKTLPNNSNTAAPDSIAEQMKKQKAEIIQRMTSAQLNYFVTKVADGKFGYNIFIDGKLYIEQNSIPAIGGNRGFDTEQDAEKIAILAMQKLRQGQMPPTISVEELKARGIQ